jgi:hypothetical protein
LDKVKTLDYLGARHNWGSEVLMRFLVGTISNILIAMFGTVISFEINQVILNVIK